MITKKYFEQIKTQLPDHEDAAEVRLVEEQRCPVCGLAQVYVGKANFKNGKGFALCANPDCNNVEEIGIDRHNEY
jgi:ssDNA-binding Zn-finger/Zn-ribbon topoisomerase 1